jgi:DnaK suppressor protein
MRVAGEPGPATVRTIPSNHCGAVVTIKGNPLDAGFIEKQRQALIKLRQSLLSAVADEEADEAAIKDESAGGPREYEDDAQKLASLELDGNLVVRDVQRLERVDRALKKIDEGTYGLSDLSGQPIARERLQAIPESIYTLTEEQAREKRR